MKFLLPNVAAFAFTARLSHHPLKTSTSLSVRTMFPDGSGDASDSESDKLHSFKLKGGYYYCLGMKGTMPWEQHQIRGSPPRLECSRCGIRAEAVRATESDVANNSTTLFKFSESDSTSYKLADPTKLKESCWRKYLSPRIENSLPGGNGASCVQDGQVILPSTIFKDVFVEELKTYGVQFDEASIFEEIEPVTLLFAAVSATQERINAFQSDVVGKLAKDVELAENELQAAKDAASIFQVYINLKDSCIYVRHCKDNEEIKKVFNRLWRRDSHLKICNKYLNSKFGVTAKVDRWGDDIQLTATVDGESEDKCP